MPNPSPRLSRRGLVMRTISATVMLIAIAVVIIAVYVYYQAVKTFEIRRVSLPTRVFTDALPLRPGRSLTADDLEEKLARLNYREGGDLGRPGEYERDGNRIRIHLRKFNYPAGSQEPMAVEIRIEDGLVASVVGTADGAPVETAALEPELLTSILGDQLENRRPVTLDQVPEDVINAVVVTEDVRFWQHPGVDPIGVTRALMRNVRAGSVSEGGSTLTQQLVKNYYLTNERTMRRKVVEAIMALILDAKYSKKEILEAYLNDIYLGRSRSISILGVGEAARYYFGKPISEVDPAEAALLAGMIRSPNNYSPFSTPERATERRNTVLGLMLRHGKIDRDQYEKALKEPLPKKPSKMKSGLSSIPFYVDRVLDELKADYGLKDVKGRGYSIYTAIDLEWQDVASKTLEDGLGRLEKSSRRLRRKDAPLEGVLVAIDVPTGEIRALVGGRDYDRSQFNRAVQARRQVGSLFKPFVYLAAFEPSLSSQNITPATLVNDQQFVLERRFAKDWSPHNYGEQYYGPVTARFALEHSLNAASVRIGLAAGLDGVLKAARALGVEDEIDAVPSIILGAPAIAPITMAEAYTSIAREGSRIPLHAVRFVTDDGGRLIASAGEAEGVQVFPARDAYLLIDLMEGVMRRGTAAGAASYGFRKTAAGKTGTTNDKRDAWFIGFTPQTLALTWVGFDDNAPTGLSGSDAAVPIWARFMSRVTADDSDRDFPVPPGITFVQIDEMTGGLAVPECPPQQVVNQAFKAGTEPMTSCSVHQPQPLPLDGYFGQFPDMTTDTTLTSTDLGVPPLEGGSFPTDTGVQPLPPPPTEIHRVPPGSTQPTATPTARPTPADGSLREQRPVPVPTPESPRLQPVPTPPPAAGASPTSTPGG